MSPGRCSASHGFDREDRARLHSYGHYSRPPRWQEKLSAYEDYSHRESQHQDSSQWQDRLGCLEQMELKDNSSWRPQQRSYSHSKSYHQQTSQDHSHHSYRQAARLLRLHSSTPGPLLPSPLPTSIIKSPRNANPDLTLGINQGDPPASLQGTFRSLSRMITRRNG